MSLRFLLKIGKVGCLNLDERFSKDGFLYYAFVVIFGPNFIVTNKYEFLFISSAGDMAHCTKVFYA